MDVNLINANRQSGNQQKPNDVQKTSAGKESVTQSTATISSNLGQTSDSVIFTAASLSLVNSKTAQTPGNMPKIENPLQAQNLVKQLAKKTQENPGQALAAYGHLLSSHLNTLEVELAR